MWGLVLSFLGRLGLSPLTPLAAALGVTEPALKLLVSVVMCYPLGVIYHKCVRTSVEFNKWKQYYLVAAGMEIAFFNFGVSMFHNMVPVVFMFVCTKVVGPGKNHVILTFILNMSYLLTGYIYTETEDGYDITWTMPQCLLAIKMIALSFDLWDGQKILAGKSSSLSANNLKTAITVEPSLLDLFGFTYFPASFMVGPICTFKRYSEFINDKYPLDEQEKQYTELAMTKMALGAFYMILHLVGGSYFTATYMYTDKFWDHNILYRHLYCGMWAHFALYKYMSCWLLSEGCCIRFGLSYNGDDAEGKGKWDGCQNIRPYMFETSTTFHTYIESFNCNTNYFAAEYIYKRLKFLGNRHLSQLFTLLFLAVWHGIKSGYYVTFFNEFIIIYMEKELIPMLEKTQFYQRLWENKYGRYAMWPILKYYTIVYMGWSFLPFDAKIVSRWFVVYQSLYFSGYILFIPWAFAWKPLLKNIFKYFKVKKIEPTKDS